MEPMSSADKKEVVAEGKYLQLIKEGPWEYVHRCKGVGASAIVAVTRDQEIVLVEQYRIPMGASVIDLPAGLVGDDSDEDDYLVAAQRELLEETGYTARSWKFLVAGPASAGLATEVVHFYLAKQAKKVAEGGGVAGENITVHVVPLSRINAWFKRQEKSGKLIDVKAFFAASWLAASQKS